MRGVDKVYYVWTGFSPPISVVKQSRGGTPQATFILSVDLRICSSIHSGQCWHLFCCQIYKLSSWCTQQSMYIRQYYTFNYDCAQCQDDDYDRCQALTKLLFLCSMVKGYLAKGHQNSIAVFWWATGNIAAFLKEGDCSYFGLDPRVVC